MGNKTRNTANLVSNNNIFVDTTNNRVGVGSTQPTAALNVVGVVSATSFWGDVSNLTGIFSNSVRSNLADAGISVNGDGLRVQTATDSGFEFVADPGDTFKDSKLRVKIKANGGITRDSDGLSVSGVGTSRVENTTTSGSISAGSTANIDYAGGYKSYALLNVGISSAAWLRIYTDSLARNADETRLQGVDPAPDAGVIVEVISTGSTSIKMSPGVIGWNNDSTPGNTMYLRLTNNSSSDATAGIAVTFKMVNLED